MLPCLMLHRDPCPSSDSLLDGCMGRVPTGLAPAPGSNGQRHPPCGEPAERLQPDNGRATGLRRPARPGCLFGGLAIPFVVPAEPMREACLHRRYFRGLALLLPLWLLLAWLCVGPVAASPAPAPASMPAPTPASTLTLDGSAGRVDAWPSVQVLFDPGHRLALADALARRDDFAKPAVPRANFGPRADTVWLRIPVRATIDERWLLEIDYPPLNRIEAWVVRAGVVVQQAVMGSDIADADRPIRSRAHVFAVHLPPGADHEVYLKVDSATTMVTPIRFHREAVFVAYESLRMLLLGLMFGSTLLLIAMTVVNGLSLRDPAFLYYGCMLVGLSMFFVSFSGLGHQFLWSTQSGHLEKISPIGALIGLGAASLFVASALDVRQRSPWVARGLQATALGALSAALAAGTGVFEYRQTALAATVLGPILIALAVTESIRQARAGSRVAVYMAIGWGAYAIGSMSMALLLRGVMPVDFMTLNLFQFSSLVEMIAWMRVLAIRIEIIRQDAERVAAEKQILHDLAHTDALTGLRNRRGLVDAIARALARPCPRFAIYLIDLDGFKAVNDGLGHEAGDETLVQVGRRLTAVLREDDIVARLGGDEFVVLAPDVSSQAAAQAIARKMLAAMREPFELGDRQVARIGATIGIAMAPDNGSEAGALLRAADEAMYAGKTAGRQCIRQAGRVAEPILV